MSVSNNNVMSLEEVGVLTMVMSLSNKGEVDENTIISLTADSKEDTIHTLDRLEVLDYIRHCNDKYYLNIYKIVGILSGGRNVQ